jgi:hypothetical protein
MTLPAVEVSSTVISRIWYCARLDARDVASGEVAVICRRFTDAIRAAGEPVGACLFVVDASGHGDVSATPTIEDASETRHTALFFSPASLAAVRDVLVRYGAKPSPAPARAGASMLVGDAKDWSLLNWAIH